MKRFLAWLRRYVSPVFIALFVASFILWYITKLNYNYTTDYDVKLNISGERIGVPCVIEGRGTNLFSYKIQIGNRIRIPVDELVTTVVPPEEEGGEEMLSIDSKSLKDAISVRVSDIKIVSLGEVPLIRNPKTAKK